ncbi:MAG: LamG-like jellyroll fold domain-containing protein [Gaiellales bacterium]
MLTAAVASAATTAWWHMNETSGGTMHDAVGSANGTNHNVMMGRRGVWRSMAYGFNGWSSYVRVPHRRALNPGPAKLTVKISVRFSALPSRDYDVIRKGQSSTPGGDYKIEIARSGQALCVFGGSRRTVAVIGGRRLNDGRWHRITCIRGWRNARLLVDGRLRRRVWKRAGSIANQAPLFVGAKPWADWFRGQLDEAKISVG